MNDDFVDGNIEETYGELTKVVNATNDLKNSLAFSVEEFIRNETEFEQVKDVLHNLRIKIISNPILRELNCITEEDANLQQKLAEDIYLELTDLSSRLDIYQENFSKLNDAYEQVQKLHSTIEHEVENKINANASLEVNLKNKYGALLKNYETDVSGKCQELKDNIKLLLENIAEENYTSKCLSYVIAGKKSTLEKLSQRNESILTELDHFQLNNNENQLLNVKEIELNTEIIELSQQSDNLSKTIDELKQQKHVHQEARRELLKISDSQKSLSEKKILYTSIQDLKMLVIKKTQELQNLNESISKLETCSSHLESELKLCEIEMNDVTDQINEQKNIREHFLQDKEDVEKDTKSLKENMKEIDEKLSVLLENKNKEEFSINISSEKEKFLVSELSKLNENICTTEGIINELNEKISKVQNELDEKTKTNLETPSYLEVEKSNSVFDLKIRRYIKAIEVLKRNRAAMMEEKERARDYSDSSQDSMLLPKKKKYS